MALCRAGADDCQHATALFAVVFVGVVGIILGTVILCCKWVVQQRKQMMENQSANAFVSQKHSLGPDELLILPTISRLLREIWNRLVVRCSFLTKIWARSRDSEQCRSGKSLLFFHCPPSMSSLNTNRCNCSSENAECDLANLIRDRNGRTSTRHHGCFEDLTDNYILSPSPINPDAVMKRYRTILRYIRKPKANVTGQVNPVFQTDQFLEQSANSDVHRNPSVMFKSIIPMKSVVDNCHTSMYKQRNQEIQQSFESRREDKVSKRDPSPETWTARPIPGIRSRSLTASRISKNSQEPCLKFQNPIPSDCQYSNHRMPSGCSSTGTHLSNSSSFIPCTSEATLESDKSERFLVCTRAVMVLRPHNYNSTDRPTVCGQGDDLNQPQSTDKRGCCSLSSSVSPLDEQSVTVLSQNTSVSLSLPPTSLPWAGDTVENEVL